MMRLSWLDCNLLALPCKAVQIDSLPRNGYTKKSEYVIIVPDVQALVRKLGLALRVA